jgi:signal transduction histidine kinase
MLDRLDRAFAGQRRFVANASHELRTPLTILRTEGEVALRRPDTPAEELRATIARMNDAVDRCDRLVTSLLALAMAEHGVEVDETVDLADVALATIRHASAEATATGVALDVDAHPAPVRGDPGLLDRLAENLVENGIRHNTDGGWVLVTTSRVGEDARLEVSNSGPPIPADQVQALFEPFRRLGRDRIDAASTTRVNGRGVGLGLSIVASIVAAHGGRIDARALTPGGLAITIDLPAST